MNFWAFIQKNKFIIGIYVLYLFVTFYGLMSVGYYYDELLHSVPTQHLLKGREYLAQIPYALAKTIQGRPIPLMILYYVGPIKTYALIPFFLIFPASLLTLRVATIFFGVITLTLLYLILKRFFNRQTMIIALLLFTTDMSFIFSSRYDWGPIAIQNILKLSVLWLFLEITNHKITRAKAYALGIISALLIWDKLNALWFLVPLHALQAVNVISKKHYSFGKYIALGFIVALIPFLIFLIKRPMFYSVSQESFQSFEHYLSVTQPNANLKALLSNYQSDGLEKTRTLIATLNGRSIPNHILMQPLHASGVFSCIVLLVAVLVMFGRISTKHTKEYYLELIKNPTPIQSVTLITFGILGWIYLTPHANGPHHMLMLYPLPHIIIAYYLSQWSQKHTKTIAVLVTLTILANLSILFETVNATTNNNMKSFWKRTEVETMLNSPQPQEAKYLALDWGISLPIAFAYQGTVTTRDLQAFYEPKCTELAHLVYQEKYQIIMYTDENQVFPTYYRSCQEIINTLNQTKTDNFVIYSQPN